MRVIKNTHRGAGFNVEGVTGKPLSTNVAAVLQLLTHCPAAAATPLTNSQALAKRTGTAQFWLKDERTRMNLGSFKATGAAFVIARDAAAQAAERGLDLDSLSDSERTSLLADRHYITASAGNHGLSVAAGAQVFGAKATIYLSETVPQSFAALLTKRGAQVAIEGEDYEQSMVGAKRAAREADATLLSDTSWPGYVEIARYVMQGYTVVAHEVVEELADQPVPTHIFLQAGVGGIAGAAAAIFREAWGDAPTIIVVEPSAAPALQASIEAGHSVITTGPVSNMGRLDCKEPSILTLASLSATADYFITIDDTSASTATEELAGMGIESSPSGIAGIAALLDPAAQDLKQQLGINENSRVLTLITEGVA